MTTPAELGKQHNVMRQIVDLFSRKESILKEVEAVSSSTFEDLLLVLDDMVWEQLKNALPFSQKRIKDIAEFRKNNILNEDRLLAVMYLLYTQHESQNSFPGASGSLSKKTENLLSCFKKAFASRARDLLGNIISSPAATIDHLKDNTDRPERVGETPDANLHGNHKLGKLLSGINSSLGTVEQMESLSVQIREKRLQSLQYQINTLVNLIHALENHYTRTKLAGAKNLTREQLQQRDRFIDDYLNDDLVKILEIWVGKWEEYAKDIASKPDTINEIQEVNQAIDAARELISKIEKN